MTRRILATTDPYDYGYKFVGELDGYYYDETGRDCRGYHLLRDNYTGRLTDDVKCPDGTVIDRHDLCDYGIFELQPDDSFDADLDLIRNAFDSAPYGYVAMGSAGRWYGTRAAGEMIADMDELIRKMISKYPDVKIEDVNGEMYIELSHHDGADCFTLRMITKKGQDWYDENYYELSDWELIDGLFNIPGYSEPPFIADRAFGPLPSKCIKPRKTAKATAKKPKAKKSLKSKTVKTSPSKCLKPKAKKAAQKQKVKALSNKPAKSSSKNVSIRSR